MDDQLNGNSETEKIEQDSRKIIVIVVISILLSVNGLLLWQFFEKKTHLEEVNKTLRSTVEERNEISAELKQIKDEYEKINQENIGLQNQLSARDEEIKTKITQIQKLINSGSAAQLQKAKEELIQLKSLNNNYTLQLDSVKKINDVLNMQNTALNENITAERGKVLSLTELNNLLANKVALGSMLKAVNISAIAVRSKSNGKESVTNRASKVQKIKTCFSLPENPVIDKGTKDVLLRILSPDGAVITTAPETFSYNGQDLLFTLKDTFYYNNEMTDLCLYSEKGSSYTIGKYNIELYSSGNLIGVTSLILK